jgi:hypothetical protein
MITSLHPPLTSPFCDHTGDPHGLWPARENALEVLNWELPRRRDGLFGVELELDWRFPAKARPALLAAFRDLPCFILKRDGSICGAEVVTVPMDMESHFTFIECMSDNGALKATQASSRDGMHVHVDRGLFSDDDLLRLLVLVMADPMQDLLDALARRKENTFCMRDCPIRGDRDPDRHVNMAQRRLADARAGLGKRYRAVNLTNTTTVEFRMFKSTTNRASYMRTLEVVRAMVSFARQPMIDPAGFIDLCGPVTFLQHVSEHRKDWPGLHRWLQTSRVFAEWQARPVTISTSKEKV